MNILAISGSLRAASINSAFCRAAALLAPPEMKIDIYAMLGELPLFNPDLESSPPKAVIVWREAVQRSDALIIASPEYAHGVSGVMKNALDWLVSFEGAIDKPIALINTSPRAHLAYDSLREVLKTMSTQFMVDASVALPLLGSTITTEAMMGSPEINAAIRSALKSILAYLNERSIEGPSFGLR